MKRLTLKRKKQSKVLKKDEWHVNVGEVTQHELLTLVSKIHHHTCPELEQLLREAENASKGETLRQAWKQDVEDRAAFEQDQRTNGEISWYTCTCTLQKTHLTCVNYLILQLVEAGGT